jgi:hypothetical protein
VDCIIAYGQKWRGAAAAALRELGFDLPQGFELWSYPVTCSVGHNGAHSLTDFLRVLDDSSLSNLACFRSALTLIPAN